MKINITKKMYNDFSEFAKFLYQQPQCHPQTGQPIIHPKTGKTIPAIPSPDVATYLLFCGKNTMDAMQMMMAAQQKANEIQSQKQQGQQ